MSNKKQGVEFQDNGDGLEMWAGGKIVATGAEAQAALDKLYKEREAAIRAESVRPSNVLRNLSDADAAKLLDLIGVKYG